MIPSFNKFSVFRADRQYTHTQNLTMGKLLIEVNIKCLRIGENGTLILHKVTQELDLEDKSNFATLPGFAV